MQKLPLLIFLYLEFAEFLSLLLCLPSNFSVRRYSRGENKLPHLLLCTSCTLRWLLNPIHRHHALQICRHPMSGGCCQQFYKREPQIRTLLSAPRFSKVENLAQHIRLCFYSPSFSFPSGKISSCLLTI